MDTRIFTVLLSLCLVVAAPVGKAAADEPVRPRIGLVLGGGGARGAAHIGVLQELERQRIPVDAIAGTSMGAVVGSLYAAGMTPDELEALVDSIDWVDAFVDTPRRRSLTFRRKEDDAAYPATIELGVNDGEIRIPRGLIQGQKLQQILRERLLPVAHIDDFDDLPTPFRAIASDLATGELYVMGEGDLALAARASMSAPGIFAPVVVDGRTLVDGGLVGNLPIDVIRDMDVDIVIAVDVEFPLYQSGQLASALEITEQVLTILIHKETLRQLDTLAANDVLIRPDLGEYGSTNFDEITGVIEPGRAAARDVAGKLANLALGEADYAAYLAARRPDRANPASIAFVRVDDDGPLSPEVLRSMLRTKPGDPVDTARLAADVNRLYGLNYYEHVDYRLVEENGRTGVEFRARAKSWGPNFLKFGLTLEDDFEGSTSFNVAARLTATGLNSRGAEWRNDLQAGTSPRFESEFFQPFGFDSRYFAAPRIDIGQDNYNVFAGPDTLGRYRVSSALAGLDLGRTLGAWGELRIGALRGAGRASLRVGDPALPEENFEIGGFRVRFDADTLDDAQFPKRGLRASVEWQLSRPTLGADNEFDKLFAAVDRLWSWGAREKNTLQLGVEFGTTWDSPGLPRDYFRLGGFHRLSGLGRGELSGPHTGLARLVYYHELGPGRGVFDMPVYVGASLEAGNAWQARDEIGLDSLITNGSVFAGIDTWLGRLFVGAGLAEGGGENLYLILGNPWPLRR